MSLFATSATTSYAQSDDGQSDKEATLQQGVWALQFQIKENFTLSAFEGTTLSVKRHTSATRAWRLGVSLGATFENSDSEDGDQSKVDRQQIALIGHYLFYPTLKDPIHLYVGPGLRGAYSRASTKNEQRRPNGELILLADGSVFEWTVGLSGTLGVEWFANKSISLLAEYSTSLSYATSGFNGDARRPSTDRNTWSLRSDNVRFGLSVYL